MEFTHYLHTKVVFGKGTISKVGDEVRKLGGSKVLVVTTGNLLEVTGYYEVITKSLNSAGVKYVIFNEVEENPSIETCEKGARISKDEGINAIVAFGGGSAMDAGKAISVLTSLGGRVSDFFFPKVVEGSTIPVIAIPTTCGTGAEVTRYAIITDLSTKRKNTMAGPAVLPKVAVIDPEVLKKIPKKLLAWTTLDALSHAVEAYTSKSATPISDGVAIIAVDYIIKYILKAYEGDEEAKGKLHIASTLGGMAINDAGTTILHAAGYYLTTHHNVQHGLANALLMPFILEYNLKFLDEGKLNILLRVTGSSTISDFINKLCKLMDAVGIPDSVSEIGFKEEELDAIASDVMGYKRNIGNNPSPVNEGIIKDFVRKAMVGRAKVYSS
ncbi:MAG: iron-containing alcohol dehydrogenase [Sulfolobales archaeon]|nr:iron-containing alcohol dehydrogenase [Sulfolobales archaeon]MDW7969786.1 iron-containing alcohol dehydrogenase [Sulfolobales archaeon]